MSDQNVSPTPEPVPGDGSAATDRIAVPPATSGATSQVPEPTKPHAGSPQKVQPPRGPLPWRHRDQILFAAASAIALVFITVYCLRTSRWGAEPIELERQAERELDFKIELNSATWVEWSQLPGIGPVLAHRIVEDRENNGPFRTIDDLDRVKGLGPKKIDALRPFVRVGTATNTERSP